ncbi:MAG TPA: hypothetical protein VK028_09630 [Micromonosporaceae bacterium]|nr:hypothetical protein [Micromonosporaceae bacterium]
MRTVTASTAHAGRRQPSPPWIPGQLPGGVPLVAWWPPGAPPEPPGEFAATPDVALLAMAAADLAAISLPGTTESTTALRWSRRALAGLVDGAYHPGWRIRGLAALTGPGLAPGVRGRAELALARRLKDFSAAADGASLGETAHLVLALCDLPGETAWRAGLARLAAARRACRAPCWPWFADHLPGGGIRLPHAMLVAAHAVHDCELTTQALESLDWFLRRSGLGNVDGVLALPSARGERAIDVADVVLALVDAQRITGRSRYGRLAHRALAWFAGVNRYGLPVYDARTGRCIDRIGPGASTHSAGAWLAYRAAVRAVCDACLASSEVTEADPALTSPGPTNPGARRRPVPDGLATAA